MASRGLRGQDADVNIVVGLGNPGRKYRDTPHNAGFMVVDELAGRMGCKTRRSLRFASRMGKARVNDGWLWLVQPERFMNNSGPVVAAILRYRKIDSREMIVVVDDADLDFGRLRIRARGGSGGHKGLASIIEYVGSEDFVRVRIGIGRDSRERALTDHVLRPFSSEERNRFNPVIERAAASVACIVDFGVEVAMNRFNSKQE